ncbi:unnamed protein product [Effrenium voratum]|nr:unnamed protein product [Effrenium voratum]
MALKAQPLLKRLGRIAVLHAMRLALRESSTGQICPIIFVGDGRSGKSYLASCLVGAEDAFTSSDSAESVTEGIDVVAVPVSQLSEAAIRTLVNVFGLLLGSQVAFVANGMATEQALQTLGMSLAARSLVRLEGAELPKQELVFVVNKNTLRYEGSALEKILEQKFDDPGRQELRDTVRECFPERSFFTVPLMGMPAFKDSLKSLRAHLVDRRKSLHMGGLPVSGRQLAGVMELIVAEVQATQEISLPSMNRYVIFEGFLLPLTNDLVDFAQGQLPEVVDYDPCLAERNPIESILRRFDESSAHVGNVTLKAEARQLLATKLWDLWHWVEAKNEALGNEVCDTVQEAQEVELSRSKSVVGGYGLLKEVVVTKQLFREEGRTVLHRKRGGDPERLPWKTLGTTVTRTKESAFDLLPSLPILKGLLYKSSPNRMRVLLRAFRWDRQPRQCVVQDGHFLWFDSEVGEVGEGAEGGGEGRAGSGGSAGEVQAKGCINFLMHRAAVSRHGDSFVIRPAEATGWQDPSSFTGDAFRSFSFAAQSEAHCAEWVDAVERHIHFAAQAAEQLGPELPRHVRVYKPTWVDLET